MGIVPRGNKHWELEKFSHIENSKEGNETAFPSDTVNVQRETTNSLFVHVRKPWVLDHVSPRLFPRGQVRQAPCEV